MYHPQIEAVTCRLQQVLRGKYPFQQYDGLRNSGAPERQAFLQPRNRERICVGKRQRRWNEAVSVALALTTAMTRAPRAALPGSFLRLWRRACVSMTARISRSHRSTPSP